MLGLPQSTEIRRQIPKDAFFSSKGIRGPKKEKFDKQIHSIAIRGIINRESVNLDAAEGVPSIYIMELQLNTEDYDESHLMLLDKLGHKTVYVLSYGNRVRLAVVETSVFQTDWMSDSDASLELEGLNLGTVWENIVRKIGNLPMDVPLKEAIAEDVRVKGIDKQIAALERQFSKEKQNHERRNLHSRIQELRKERDAGPSIKTETAEQVSRVRPAVSVTRRIMEIIQPPGGYINPRLLTETVLDDGKALGPENIDPSIVGLAVDYLTRYIMTGDLSGAFLVSIFGGMYAGKSMKVAEYMCQITGLDDRSIENACRTCMFDTYYRVGRPPRQDPEFLKVDHQTCENIRIMIDRARSFFEEYGPVTASGPRFPGGYTETVGNSDGDYLTEDTLWDFKVSKNVPTKEITLQLAMYYIMGKHSTDSRFETIRNIGIFNPRKNVVYMLDMSRVSKDLLRRIETEVIGYRESDLLDW